MKNKGAFLATTLLGLWIHSFAFAEENTAGSPFDIDLSTPDSAAVESVNRPKATDTGHQSAISTTIQNMNPDISFVGDFLAGSSSALYQADDTIHRPIYLREVEIDGAGYISPYAKGFVVTSFGEDGEVDVEEANMNFFNLPASLSLKLGKMFVDTDTINPLHQHAIPFVDRPLVLHHAFGTEGLKTVGGNLSWIVPNPWDHYILLSGTVGVNNADQENLSVLFGGNIRTLLYNVRASSSWDLSSTSYINVNLSSLLSPLPDHSLTRVYIADALIRFAPNPAANAVTLLNGFVWSEGNPYETGYVVTRGFYDYLGWQFSPRWRVGGRYDQTDYPAYGGREKQISGVLSFYPTETNYLRFQYSRHQTPDGGPTPGLWEDKVWLQVNFSMGPHQQHTAL